MAIDVFAQARKLNKLEQDLSADDSDLSTEDRIEKYKKFLELHNYKIEEVSSDAIEDTLNVSMSVGHTMRPPIHSSSTYPTFETIKLHVSMPSFTYEFEQDSKEDYIMARFAGELVNAVKSKIKYRKTYPSSIRNNFDFQPFDDYEAIVRIQFEE